MLRGLPWWMKWVVVPAIVLVVFGSLVVSALGWIIGLLLKVLVFAMVIAAALFAVRKVTSFFSSGGG